MAVRNVKARGFTSIGHNKRQWAKADLIQSVTWHCYNKPECIIFRGCQINALAAHAEWSYTDSGHAVHDFVICNCIKIIMMSVFRRMAFDTLWLDWIRANKTSPLWLMSKWKILALTTMAHANHHPDAVQNHLHLYELCVQKFHSEVTHNCTLFMLLTCFDLI